MVSNVCPKCLLAHWDAIGIKRFVVTPYTSEKLLIVENFFWNILQVVAMLQN